VQETFTQVCRSGFVDGILVYSGPSEIGTAADKSGNRRTPLVRGHRMMERGRIIMSRQVFYDIKKRYPQSPHLYEVYTHLVFQASYHPEMMGSFDTTNMDISEDLDLSYGKVRSAIRRLKNMGMITVKKRSVGGENVGIRVTIQDYEMLHRAFEDRTDPRADLRASLTVSGPSSTEDS
jgi:hypothetical protein